MSRYHDILGIPPSASQEQIKSAFRERALECHPDRAEEGRKEAAQEEFMRVRRAFEILSDDEDRRARPSAHPSDGEHSASGRTRRPRRSYKEEWKKYKNQRVSVGKDIVENVRGLSSEYDLVRQKNAITIPVSFVACALVFLFDPLTMYGTGVFLVDFLLCGLVGSVYGFALGSIWAYLELFLSDYRNG